MIRTALAGLLVPLFAVASPLAASVPSTEMHYVMGTYFRIAAEGSTARPVMRSCFQEARRLEAVFSRFDPASELSRVNASAGVPREVSTDFARLLRRARVLTAATGGSFDVTVGSLAELWRQEREPSAAELALGRDAVGRARVRLAGGRVTLAPGTRLDFDGIAKGYAVDACTARLRAAGIRRALVSLGESSIAAIGAPRGARSWRLAVRGPDPDEVVGELRLRDAAVSVSATFGGPGRRPSAVGHIIDPRTGRPLTEAAAALVVAQSATDAEAYSKAALIWGAGAMARVERLGALGAVHIGPAAIDQGPRASRRRIFEPLAQPRRLSEREEAAR